MIKIESGIPIPAIYGKYSKYPFGKMEIGNSFAIDSKDDVAAVRQAASQYAKRHGRKIKFSTRRYENGYRCWRVK